MENAVDKNHQELPLWEEVVESSDHFYLKSYKIFDLTITFLTFSMTGKIV